MNHFISDYFTCQLLHKKRPFLTGKKIWIEEEGKYVEEIIWICDECEKKNSEKRMNHDTRISDR